MKTVQDIRNHWEKQERLATQEEMKWIQAGNTLRALQSRRIRELYSRKLGDNKDNLDK